MGSTIDVSPPEVFLLNRIFTYELNAAVDARMAAALIAFLRDGWLPDGRTPRPRSVRRTPSAWRPLIPDPMRPWR